MGWIVKVDGRGKVRYAGASNGPPEPDKDKAHVFFDKKEAENIASRVRRIVPDDVAVTLEEQG